MKQDLEIRLLADHTEAVPTLQAWFETEWAPYYGPGKPGDAERDLLESANREDLPIAFVAFCDGEVCGTGALKRESVTTHPHLSPWLAALLVGPDFRRQGAGEALIAAIEEKARELGFEAIYCGTDPGESDLTPDNPRSLLERRGWEHLETVRYYVSDAAIYRKRL